MSVNAFMQASMTRIESVSSRVSCLSAVVCFLYCFQVIIYAILSTQLGRYVDMQSPGEVVHQRLIWTIGVQYTILCAIMFASTFIPEGSCAINPKRIGDQVLDEDIDEYPNAEGKPGPELGDPSTACHYKQETSIESRGIDEAYYERQTECRCSEWFPPFLVPAWLRRFPSANDKRTMNDSDNSKEQLESVA